MHRKKYLLKLHCINYKEENGRLYAEEVYTVYGVGFSKWLDITDLTIHELYMWLGY